MAAEKGRVLLAYSGGLGMHVWNLHSPGRWLTVLLFPLSFTDTSCILAWLIEEGYEVYTFMADVGQEEVKITIGAAVQSVLKLAIHLKGLRSCAREGPQSWRQEILPRSQYYNCDVFHFLLNQVGTFKDLKREFVTELIYPAVQANCIYEVRKEIEGCHLDWTYGLFREFIS